jgi:hypothetical protein
MKTFTVYRMDYAKGIKIPIGAIEERRTRERGGNFFGLLFLARKKFAESPSDAFRITFGKPRFDGRQANTVGGIGTES